MSMTTLPVPTSATRHGKFRSFKCALFPGLHNRLDIACDEGMDAYALFQHHTLGFPGYGSADQLLDGVGFQRFNPLSQIALPQIDQVRVQAFVVTQLQKQDRSG